MFPMLKYKLTYVPLMKYFLVRSDEGHRVRSQRYDESDLYKPRPTICHRRRAPSPGYADSGPGRKRQREESPESGSRRPTSSPKEDGDHSAKRRRQSTPENMSGMILIC